MAIKIQTAEVVSTAERIAQSNQGIKEDFGQVEEAMRTLNQHWDSSAADAAMTSFYSIRNTFVQSRFDVVNALVSFLSERVGGRYEKTEQDLCSAASAFK